MYVETSDVKDSLTKTNKQKNQGFVSEEQL